MTVLNGDGLVGRVVRTTQATATVLLIGDRNSTVGGRLNASMALGFVSGRGEVGAALLDYKLVDLKARPKVGDRIVTWGSQRQRAVRAGRADRRGHLGDAERGDSRLHRHRQAVRRSRPGSTPSAWSPVRRPGDRAHNSNHQPQKGRETDVIAVLRIGLAALFLLVAVTVQTSVLSNIAVAGVTCDLVLIVVIALALSRGAEWGAIAGFSGGLLLDVVPPADHTAGRWALALAIAGYVAGLIRRETSAGPVGPLVVAATVVLGTTLSPLHLLRYRLAAARPVGRLG